MGDAVFAAILIIVLLCTVYFCSKRTVCKDGKQHEYADAKFEGFHIVYKCKKCDNEFIDTIYY